MSDASSARRTRRYVTALAAVLALLAWPGGGSAASMEAATTRGSIAWIRTMGGPRNETCDGLARGGTAV